MGPCIPDPWRSPPPAARASSCSAPAGPARRLGSSNAIPDAIYLDLLDHALYLELLARPQRLRDLIPPGYDGWVVVDEVQRTPLVLNEVHRLMEGRRAPLHPDRIERAQPAPARRQPAGRPCAHLPPAPADGGRGRRRLRAGARADPGSAPIGVHPARSGRVPGIVRRELPAPGGAGRRTHPQPGHVQPVPGKCQLLPGGTPQRCRGGTRRRRGPQDSRRLLRLAGGPADRGQGARSSPSGPSAA